MKRTAIHYETAADAGEHQILYLSIGPARTLLGIASA
jgi:hypothetical protein